MLFNRCDQVHKFTAVASDHYHFVWIDRVCAFYILILNWSTSKAESCVMSTCLFHIHRTSAEKFVGERFMGAREKRLHLLCTFKMNRQGKTGFFPPILFSHLFKKKIQKANDRTGWNMDKSNESRIGQNGNSVISWIRFRAAHGLRVGCKSNANSNSIFEP